MLFWISPWYEKVIASSQEVERKLVSLKLHCLEYCGYCVQVSKMKINNIDETLFPLPLLCGYTRLSFSRRWTQRRISHSAAYFETYNQYDSDIKTESNREHWRTLEETHCNSKVQHFQKNLLWKGSEIVPYKETKQNMQTTGSDMYKCIGEDPETALFTCMSQEHSGPDEHLCYRQMVTRDSGNVWQT